MGKRSHGKFERNPRDLYDTPMSAVLPLIPFLTRGVRFLAPCYGNGHLVEHLQAHDMVCVGAYDIEPRFSHVRQADATIDTYDLAGADMIIENPPWDRKLLHPIIHNFSRQMPTWLLFDADWAHTKQAGPLLPMCAKIVAVGRVKWIEDSEHTGKDNTAWHLFDSAHASGPRFYGRGQPVENMLNDGENEFHPDASQADPPHFAQINEALFQRVSRELSPQSSEQLSSSMNPYN